ncbi:MAG: hypothetical protein KH328_01520 [Staphylococcus sp.]|nr:hypothetical protein [Staphylococcus sp.]
MYRNLEAELKREGITRRKLAEKLNLNISTICNKLSGKQPITLEEANQIVTKVFNSKYSLAYLFEIDNRI